MDPYKVQSSFGSISVVYFINSEGKWSFDMNDSVDLAELIIHFGENSKAHLLFS